MADALAPAVDRPGDVRSAAQVVVRAGMAVALLLMAVGLVVRAIEGGAAHAVRFTDLLSAPTPGDQLLMAGVLVLALTPAAQVVALLLSWLRLRDYRYSAVAAVVVGLIALSVLLGVGS
jgi:uncharacterized membrane protein